MTSPENPAVPELSDAMYHEIYTAGFHSAMRVHGNFHSAQDAVQEGAIASWLAEQRSILLDNPVAFGTVVARRRALDEQKAMSGISICSETVNHSLETGNPTDDYSLVDTYSAVRRVLAELDTDVRATGARAEVLRLTALEFTPTEISEALGITVNNVTTLLHRARTTLRKRTGFGL